MKSPFYDFVKIGNSFSIAGLYTVIPLPNTGPMSAAFIKRGAQLTLQDWIPLETPAQDDNFWGINRSCDPLTLAGVRTGYRAGETAEETILTFSALMARENANPNLVFVPPSIYNDLRSLNYNKQVINGNPAVFMLGARGFLTCVLDPTLTNLGYFISTNTWVMGDTLYCIDPGKNGVVAFGPTPHRITEIKKCQCGAEAVGSQIHSTWCK